MAAQGSVGGSRVATEGFGRKGSGLRGPEIGPKSGRGAGNSDRNGRKPLLRPLRVSEAVTGDTCGDRKRLL